MSFLKKIWPQCHHGPGARSCQDVPRGSSITVPVVVGDPPRRALLRCADCSSLPRKHFSHKDASVHRLWICVSWISQARAWWQQSQAKDPSKIHRNYGKDRFKRNPYTQTLSPLFCVTAPEQHTPKKLHLGWMAHLPPPLTECSITLCA